MNKLVATTLESKIHVFDMKTQHPEKGFASVVEKVGNNSSISIIILLLFSSPLRRTIPQYGLVDICHKIETFS